MLRIQGTAYAPGQAHGRISRETSAIRPENLMLLTPAILKTYEKVQAGTVQHPAGLVIVGAMPLSHIMIRLLGLGIPMIVITAAQAELLANGQQVAIDGSTGMITSDIEITVSHPPSPSVAGEPVMTADDQAIALRTSLADANAAALALGNGATAIGLVRSECLIPDDNRPPDSAFYYSTLKAICAAAQPLSVTIRLLDIAPDKIPDWLPIIKGSNVPLGLQGIRLYGVKAVREVIDVELEAIARLARKYSLNVLLPYVTYVDEFLYWRDTIASQLPAAVTIGAMAETPAAVLAIDDLLRHTELVAIGCNDLMQCLCAASRNEPEVGAYLDPYAPSLFRFLHQAAQAAGEKIDRIQLCGLLPQVPGILPVLLGMGYRAFSVEARLLPYLAEVVRRIDTQEAAMLTTAVCSSADSATVRSILGLPQQAAWAMPR